MFAAHAIGAAVAAFLLLFTAGGWLLETWPLPTGFDGIGARHDAFTSKEYTCFWARLRSADLPLAADILGEMLQRPAFRQHCMIPVV